MFRITFSKENVKRFQQELQKAYKRGDIRAIRHFSVLVMIGVTLRWRSYWRCGMFLNRQFTIG